MVEGGKNPKTGERRPFNISEVRFVKSIIMAIVCLPIGIYILVEDQKNLPIDKIYGWAFIGFAAMVFLVMEYGKYGPKINLQLKF
ncbi:MAG: hypothetical protein ABH863_00230 [Candidatus Micrarchaeota archaeon]